MTKQLTEKQREKIKEANELGQQCLQVARQINQMMDEMLRTN